MVMNLITSLISNIKERLMTAIDCVYGLANSTQ